MNAFSRLALAMVMLFVLTQESVAEPEQSAAPEADQVRWNELMAEQQALEKEIETKFQEIQKRMQSATPEERPSVQAQYQQMAQAYRKQYEQLGGKIISLAPAIYEQNPKDVFAAEIVMQTAFGKHQYRQAADVADRLIAEGLISPIALNMGGAAHFNNHEFKKAKELFEQAQQSNMLDQLGRQYLTAATAYENLWEKEQALRAAEAAAEPENALPQILLKTTRGDMLLELFENQAPNTVANFVSLTENKEYDGTTFHRVIPNFMAQGGDPNSKDENPSNDGSGGPPYTIACETDRPDARMHFSGSLSMAHAGKDTGGSQFFITHRPTDHLNGKHTVFGRVVDGLDTAKSLQKGDVIQSATVVRKRNHPYKPVTTPKQR